MKLQKLKSIGQLLAVAVGSIAFYEYGDEFLLAGKREQQLEERLGKQVFLGWREERAAREEKVALLENTIERARTYWDNFEPQFSQVPFLSICKKSDTIEAGADSLTGAIRIGCTGKAGGYYCAEDDSFVHELAHVWYDSIPDRDLFTRRWKEISSGEYLGKSSYKLDKFNYKEQARRAQELATTSTYGTVSLNEDVAETALFVYRLVNPYYQVFPFEDTPPLDYTSTTFHFANVITRPILLRVIEKIHLLREYRFISPREEGEACRKLELYLRDNQIPDSNSRGAQ